jgi:hypothetical protein
MENQEERLECCCRDGQATFVGRALDRLGLGAAPCQLLLHSFREVSVQIPLEVGHGSEAVLVTFTVVGTGLLGGIGVAVSLLLASLSPQTQS